MADPAGADPIASEILRVLQRIEAKLDGREERFTNLEGNTRRARDCNDHVIQDRNSLHAVKPSRLYLEASRPCRKDIPPNEDVAEDAKTILKKPYSQWEFDQTDGFSSFHLPSLLTERLQDCWSMPDDNRLPLRFLKSNVLKTNALSGIPYDHYPARRHAIERDLEYICQFDETLRMHPGNDFVIIDFDEADNSRTYRLGHKAIGPELEVEAQGSKGAPWSRLILYQGATSGDSIRKGKNSTSHQQPIPYFASTDKILGLWEHLDYHLQAKRRGTTINPYANYWVGFHTSFYEIHEVTEWHVKEIWKHGPLYGHPLGWHFRKCAYTIYGPVSADETEASGNTHGNMGRLWTLLVLAPDRFFDESNTSFPMYTSSSQERAQTLGYPLAKLNQLGAEVHLIGQGLERIASRWADFLSYFDYILDGGDSLMKPTEHDNLLFDDEVFSRSRRYFWAIDCLSEFELSITDNLTQWELYKAARLSPVKDLPELFQRQVAFAERQYRVLQNQRESFRQRLLSTKALRDALFNASAVIESRASTRLSENVKLLTFSLWSVNDHFSYTALIYVIIIVALLTYFVMFNINSLVHFWGQVYEIKKKHVVRTMKRDKDEAWKQRGHRFEVFRPKHEDPQPSEWYIPFYALINLTAILGLYRANTAQMHQLGTNEDRLAQSSRSIGIASLFRRRKRKVDEEIKNEEPWVIE